MVHCIYLGVAGYNFQKKYCILLSEDLFTFTNSVDLDEMQYYAAFHLGLQCLQKYSLRVSQIQRVKCPCLCIQSD